MKVAIHHIEKSFSHRWIEYCQENGVDFALINLRQSDIIPSLKVSGFTHLMCHVPNEDSQLIQIVDGVFHAAEVIGIKTFPSLQERWHFDNKIFQKYLLEAVGAPYAKTKVFYTKQAATAYVSEASFPLVAKLKRGAGAVNVQLLDSKTKANSYIETLFSVGINPVPKPTDHLKDKINYSKQFKNPIEFFSKGMNYLKRIRKERKTVEKEKSYVLFQEFLPSNTFDTRIVVTENIAFGLRRINRDNDFRASGSGKIEYNADLIDQEMIKIAFSISEKCGFNLMAYDFLYDKNRKPVLVEMCYGFTANAYDQCEGYWTRNLQFHKSSFSPHHLVIKNFLQNNDNA